MYFEVFLTLIGLFLGQGVTHAINPTLTTFFAIAFLFITCGLSFWSLSQSIGWQKSFFLFGALSLFAISFETLALQTGIPYGSFRYTGLIGTSLPGGAAWTIPFGWTPLVLTSFYLGRNYKQCWNILLGIFILCLCDLLLDPVATALGYWEWQASSFSYYGVPLQNFFGWVLSGGIGVAITAHLIKRQSTTSLSATINRGSFLLVSFHLAAAIRLGQLLPALTGCILLGILFVSAKQSTNITSRRS